jgi:hypothetical protein
VSIDGRQVAWSAEGGVSVGDRAGPKLTLTRHTSRTGDLGPIAFAGGGVLLAPTNGDAGYDMWFPAQGSFVPGPATDATVLTPTAHGTQLFGLAGRPHPCLVLLEPAGFTPTRQACGLDLKADPLLVPSPGGRWLLAIHPDRADVYDLSTVWTVAAVEASWAVAAENAVWVDPDSFVLHGHRLLVRAYVGDPSRLDLLRTDGVVDGDVVPVPAARP